MGHSKGVVDTDGRLVVGRQVDVGVWWFTIHLFPLSACSSTAQEERPVLMCPEDFSPTSPPHWPPPTIAGFHSLELHFPTREKNQNTTATRNPFSQQLQAAADKMGM